MLDRTLFARHLDLAPLRGRSHGLVKCIFHPDRSPSLSIDLEAMVWFCHGCGANGGANAFAIRVGELPDETQRMTSPAPEFLAVLRFARSQPWNDEVISHLYQLQDWIRHTRTWVEESRRQAKDLESGWALLEVVAALDRLANRVETQVDEVISGPPL